jgi:CBS domain-containing protein
MPTVQDVLSDKGNCLHAVSPKMTVLTATQLMNEHKIGAVVVMENGKVAGMFTERDVLTRVVAEQRPPADTFVEEVMTRGVISCDPHADLDEISSVMKERRIRHIPVCMKCGTLVGLISIGDVNAHFASNQQQHIHFLSEYIYGRI